MGFAVNGTNSVSWCPLPFGRVALLLNTAPAPLNTTTE